MDEYILSTDHCGRLFLRATRKFFPCLVRSSSGTSMGQNRASSLLSNKGSYTSPDLGSWFIWTIYWFLSLDFLYPIPLPKHDSSPEVQSLIETVNNLCIATAALLSKHEVKSKALWGRSSSHPKQMVTNGAFQRPRSPHIYLPGEQQNKPILLYVQNFPRRPIFWCPWWHIAKWNKSIKNSNLFLKYIFQEVWVSTAATSQPEPELSATLNYFLNQR